MLKLYDFISEGKKPERVVNRRGENLYPQQQMARCLRETFYSLKPNFQI